MLGGCSFWRKKKFWLLFPMRGRTMLVKLISWGAERPQTQMWPNPKPNIWSSPLNLMIYLTGACVLSLQGRPVHTMWLCQEIYVPTMRLLHFTQGCRESVKREQEASKSQNSSRSSYWYLISNHLLPLNHCCNEFFSCKLILVDAAVPSSTFVSMVQKVHHEGTKSHNIAIGS